MVKKPDWERTRPRPSQEGQEVGLEPGLIKGGKVFNAVVLTGTMGLVLYVAVLWIGDLYMQSGARAVIIPCVAVWVLVRFHRYVLSFYPSRFRFQLG